MPEKSSVKLPLAVEVVEADGRGTSVVEAVEVEADKRGAAGVSGTEMGKADERNFPISERKIKIPPKNIITKQTKGKTNLMAYFFLLIV